MPPIIPTGLAAEFGGVLGDAIKEILIAKRTEIVAAVNAKLNVPLLSEDIEGRLIGVVYDGVVEVIDQVL